MSCQTNSTDPLPYLEPLFGGDKLKKQKPTLVILIWRERETVYASKHIPTHKGNNTKEHVNKCKFLWYTPIYNYIDNGSFHRIYGLSLIVNRRKNRNWKREFERKKRKNVNT